MTKRIVPSWLCTLVACCALMSGCKVVDRLRGEGYDDRIGVEDSGWDQMRPSNPAAKAFGFSEKARQTERNLGFR